MNVKLCPCYRLLGVLLRSDMIALFLAAPSNQRSNYSSQLNFVDGSDDLVPRCTILPQEQTC